MSNTKKVSPIGTVAIFSLFLVAMGMTITTPAMAKFADAFPGKNFALISTLPTLFMVPANLWAGAVAGKKVKYRTLALVGSIMYVVFGTLPAFSESWTVMMFSRALFGVALGLMAPLGNALIYGNYEGQKQAAFIGYGTLITNAGGIVLQMLGGILSDMSWQTTFYAHLFGLISLVFAFALPEPEKAAPAEKQAQEGPKAKLGGAVFVIAALFMVLNILNYPVMMNMSLLFETKHAGGATVAATALSMYTVAGCVAGLVYGTIFKAVPKFTISIGWLGSALGVLIIYMGQSALVMTIGTCVLGFSMSVLMPSGFTAMGMRVHPSIAALATSIVMGLMNLGAFVSTFWLNLLTAIFKENIYSSMKVEIVIFVILGVFFLFYNPFAEKKG